MFRGRTDSNSWHLFDFRGHRIEMEPWFLALVAFFSFIGINAQAHGLSAVLASLVIWAPTLFVGVLFHEFGHAAAMKHFGYGGSRIVLQGFGGVTINDRRQRSPPGKSILISLAGPFASLLLSSLSFGALAIYKGAAGFEFTSLGGSLGLLARFMFTMGLINTVWALFNLIPINPLDGGHVVLHALRAKYGDRRKAMRHTAIASLVVLGGLVVVSVVVPIFDPILFFLLAFMFGIQNYQILKATGSEGPPGGYYQPR
ncbi:MAG: M50 family metallopeptidase [Bradymonadaceae bacterium]